MKKIKFSLPILALILGIAASAFTVKTQNTASTDERLLYWYLVDGNGNIGTQIGSGQETKTDAIMDGPCENQVAPDCARGYTSQQTLGVPAPPVSAEDAHILFSN